MPWNLNYRLSDAGSRLVSKFGSATHRNKELGRHRGRRGRNKCLFHAKWQCRVVYELCKLRELLGDGLSIMRAWRV